MDIILGCGNSIKILMRIANYLEDLDVRLVSPVFKRRLRLFKRQFKNKRNFYFGLTVFNSTNFSQVISPHQWTLS